MGNAAVHRNLDSVWGTENATVTQTYRLQPELEGSRLTSTGFAQPPSPLVLPHKALTAVGLSRRRPSTYAMLSPLRRRPRSCLWCSVCLDNTLCYQAHRY